MVTSCIQYITESSDLVYHVGKNEVWRGYFIIKSEKAMDISITGLLGGENANASIHVISMLSGNASVTLKTFQHHVSKKTKSDVLVKTVISGDASFVFDGNICVDAHADKTDAYQRNENLILSENAKVISRPTLEIMASDVRCSHGAATGEIPFEEIWYLKTRGLSQKEAQTIYIQGFLYSGLIGLKQDMSETITRRIMGI